MNFKSIILAICMVLAAFTGQSRIHAGEEDKIIRGKLEASDPPDPFVKQAFKVDAPHKVHTVKIEAGKGYVIDVESDEFDPLVRIEDSAGDTVAIDDDSGEGLNARVTLAAAEKGDFRILVVSVKGTGSYAVKLRPAKTPLAVRGKLAQAIETHNVKLAPGTRYVISLTSKDFDSFLRIEDSKGKRIAEDDDGGIGLNSRIVFEPNTVDDYKLIATSFDGDGRGVYDLTVVAGSSAAIPMAIKGKVTKGELAASDPRDRFQERSPHKIYTFKMTPGDVYAIDLESDDFDAFLRLESPTAEPLAVDDDSGGNLNARIVFEPKAEGEYRIIATSLQSGAGDFTLRVGKFKAKTVLDVEGGLTEKIASHKIKMTGQRHYAVDVKSKAFDTYIRLRNPAGEAIAEDDDGGEGLNSRIHIAAPAEGDYELDVTSFDGAGRGPYTVTVRELVPADDND